MKIKAAVVHKPNAPYLIEEVELAPPKAGEVLVKVIASGICHTDQAMVENALNSATFPIVPGHEGCGIVAEVGRDVRGFKPGDRVCMSFSYCGQCLPCVTGRPYGCELNMKLNFGGRCYDGTSRISLDGKDVSNLFNQSSFAAYSVTHQNNLVRIPDDIDIDMPLTAPLGCGVQTGAGTVINYLKAVPGSAIVVFGCGSVGLSAVMAAKLCGCLQIIGVDIVDARLDLALELGATHVVNARKTDDTVSCVRELTKGRGTDYAVDTTGSGLSVRQALTCTGSFGVCAMVGATAEITIMGSAELSGHHRTLAGIIEGHCIPSLFIPKLLNLYRDGLFPFDKLITYYPFEQINKAAEDSLSGAAVKPVLLIEGA